MNAWFKGFLANSGVFGEIFLYFIKNKKWWLIPMVVLLLILGLLLVFVAATGIGPFIYTLF